MKNTLILVALLFGLTACEEYSVERGDISRSGQIINSQLLQYAQKLEGVYHGRYIDVTGTYLKNGSLFFGEYDRYPAVLKFWMDGNKPNLQILLKVDVVPACMPELTNIKSVRVSDNSISAVVGFHFNAECEDYERNAVLAVSIDKDTKTISRVHMTRKSGNRHIPFFTQK